METLSLIGLGGAVLVGASTQRITGMGFALVASPMLVLLIGPAAGVSLLQVLGVITSLIVLAGVWRDVEWRTLPWLIVPAAIGIVPGAWLARQLPGPILEIVVGLLVIVALLATVASERARVFTGRGGAAAAGWLSGFMNAIAAVGGPAMVLYKLSVNWEHKIFVATVQVYFIFLSSLTLVARGLPQLPPAGWIVALAAMAAGVMIGDRLAGRVSDETARRLVLLVAFGGAVATVIKGLAGL